MQVNCFLDEGSDTSYVNKDVTEELGFGGRKEKVIIIVANGQKVNLMSATMEIGLVSLDGRVDTVIVAKTSNNICVRLREERIANNQDSGCPVGRHKRQIFLLTLITVRWI